jgi:hypothetical protein
MDCAVDSDCGALSEVCTATQTDPTVACHVDCSLGGAAACPPEYECAAVTVGGAPRMLCAPVGATCAESAGGYCDRVRTPQPCVIANDAGTCPGQRYCISGGRYDSCGGTTPQCKPDCGAVDQTGCTEVFCASATTTPQHCGSCTNTCAGIGAPSSDVVCNSMSCVFTCQGERYDVNNSEGDGCEGTDTTPPSHTTDIGSVDCDDGNGHTVRSSGILPSDSRVHSPPVASLNPATGAVPDLFTINATGGTFCVNDSHLVLTVSGSGSLDCYELEEVTGRGTYTCTTNASGTCTIDRGSGSYGDNSLITLTVQKTCSSASRGRVTYTIDGHI